MKNHFWLLMMLFFFAASMIHLSVLSKDQPNPSETNLRGLRAKSLEARNPEFFPRGHVAYGQPSFHLIGSGGIGLAWVKDGSDELKSIVHFQSGLEFLYPLAPNFSLRSGINLIQKGYRVAYEEDDLNSLTYQNHFYYLSVPLLAHVYFGNHWQGFFHGGTELSYFAGGTQQGESKLNGEVSQIDQNLGEGIKSMDIGWRLGGGLSIPLKEIKRGISYRMMVQLDYRSSWTRFFEPVGDAVDIPLKHAGVSLSVGIEFVLP